MMRNLMVLVFVVGAARVAIAEQVRLAPSSLSDFYIVPKGSSLSLGDAISDPPTLAATKIAPRCAAVLKNDRVRAPSSDLTYSVRVNSAAELTKPGASAVVSQLLHDAFGDTLFRSDEVFYSINVRLKESTVIADQDRAALEHCCSISDKNCAGRWYVNETAVAEMEALELEPNKIFKFFNNGQNVRRSDRQTYQYVRIVDAPPKTPISLSTVTSIGSSTFDFGNGKANRELADKLRFRITRPTFHGTIGVSIPDKEFVFAGKQQGEHLTEVKTRCDRDSKAVGDGCDLTASLIVAHQLKSSKAFRVVVSLKDDFADDVTDVPFSEFLYSQPAVLNTQLSAAAASSEPLALSVAVPASASSASAYFAICAPSLPADSSVQATASLLDIAGLEVAARCDAPAFAKQQLTAPLACDNEDLHWCKVDVSLACPANGPTCVPPPLSKFIVGFSRSDIGPHLLYPVKLVVIGAPAPVLIKSGN